jgi:hypothetical protein
MGFEGLADAGLFGAAIRGSGRRKPAPGAPTLAPSPRKVLLAMPGWTETMRPRLWTTSGSSK